MRKKSHPQKRRTPFGFPATGKPQMISPGNLILDPDNLRLLETFPSELVNIQVKLYGQDAVQDKIENLLYNNPRANVSTLRESILSNGFLRHEHLIVVPYSASKYLVLEGNRRLTAVRSILKAPGLLSELNPDIVETLEALPCFVLDGSTILDCPESLKKYRESAEIYIGIRHLMGVQKWEPASRYEFQARLLDRNWTVEEIADHFGRSQSEVLRDVRAHKLYREFKKYEKANNLDHNLTYNAFAEAARAAAVNNWLGWNSLCLEYKNKTNVASFFHYLVISLKLPSSNQTEDFPDPDSSAESIVRALNQMLKLADKDIQDALSDHDYVKAHNMYEDRRQGKFAARIRMYLRQLKMASVSELKETPQELIGLLKELITQAEELRNTIVHMSPRK